MTASLTRLGAFVGIALLAACDRPAPEAQTDAPAAWAPTPATDAVEPSETIESAPADAWRAVAPDNLLLLDIAAAPGAPGGRVAIELAPEFAPVHVANIRALARGGYWNGSAIYRIQDNYVAQWGVNEGGPPLPQGVVEAPPAEYERALDGLALRPLGFPDAYAPEVGHALGWPVGMDRGRGRAWLAHCYGMVGAGRDLSPDTGTGGELYAVIGHAPRHLDRNIATVGRVLDGIGLLSARPRGTGALGFYEDRGQDIRITRATLAADLPEGQRPAYQVMRTDSPAFAAFVKGRANRGGDFFDVAAGGVDLCNALVPTRPAP